MYFFETLRKIFIEKLQEKIPVLSILFLFFFFAFALSSSFVDRVQSATAPSIITYQGKLLNSGAAVDATTSIKFLIYDDPTGGTLQYTAGGTDAVPAAISVFVSDGIFSVNMGAAGTNNVTSSIFSDSDTLYLEVTVEGTVLTPRKRLNSSPYALNSAYLMGYSAVTASSSTYIPLSDANGNLTFSGDPQSSSVGGGSLYVNPAMAADDETLFGVGVTGGERFRVDNEGDAWVYGNLTATGTATSSFTNVLVTDGITLGGVKQTSWPGGGSGDVVASTTNNFLATNTFYNVVDFRGKIATPTVIGSLSLGTGIANDIFVSHQYAYVAASADGLRVIDITDPNNPALVGQEDTDPGTAYSVVVSGNYAYVAYSSGLAIFDVSVPSAPVKIGDTVGGSGDDLALSGNYVYLLSNAAGLRSIDITDPYNPQVFDTLNVGTGTLENLEISGHFAYITDTDDGLFVIDISNPTDLVQVGTVDNGNYASALVLSGHYAYIGNNLDSSVEIIDVADPTSPVLADSLALNGFAAETPIDLMTAGNYLFIGANSADLLVFDATSSTAPSRVGTIDDIASIDVFSIFSDGNYIYSAGREVGVGGHLNVIDISGAKISTAQVGTLKVRSED